MIIIYVDIVLLAILMLLVVFTCGYCLYRLHRMQQSGQVAILLKPTRVLFSHRKDGESTEELRTVVAYQNPFTGDYCVHKSRAGGKCYVNPSMPVSALPGPDSPDSGLSDAYEPLELLPRPRDPAQPHSAAAGGAQPQVFEVPLTLTPDTASEYAVSKTWSWNYTEYQI